MASIESLLNPLPNLTRSDRSSFLPTPSPTSSTSTMVLRPPRQKKQKIAKDAPIFNRGKIRGELRYPPHEERDEELAKLHREFHIHPFGDIAAYPRHIPYNSDKKMFQERTGRESFEVFQYTFQLPGEEKQWTVMWDYNIGLVRTTHLFKCNDYSKTTPAKMLNLNPGLREVCHSITGGALAAQGYWMPFEAAKAVAATFCWKIRFALTPLFGVDFPSLCPQPHDRSRYGRMVIDPAIVRTATERANFYRMLELRSPSMNALRPGYRPSSSEDRSLGRHILPKSHHRHNRSGTVTDGSTTGYGSSPEYSSSTDIYCVSPISPIRNSFTPVNTPRSTDMVYPSLPSPHQVLASLVTSSIPSSIPLKNTTRVNLVEGSDADADEESTSSTLYSDSSDVTDDMSPYPDDDDDDDDGSYRESDVGVHFCTSTRTTSRKRGRRSQLLPSHPADDDHGQSKIETGINTSRLLCEVKAAHALLSLHMQDAMGSDNDNSYNGNAPSPFVWKGRKRRRASA